MQPLMAGKRSNVTPLQSNNWSQEDYESVEAYMSRFVIAGAATLALFSFSAAAQTSTETTTTRSTTLPGAMAPQAVPAPVPALPPDGSLSTRTTQGVDAYGNRVYSKSTTYRDSQGVATDRQSTTVTPPPPMPPPATTSTSTSTTTTTNAPN